MADIERERKAMSEKKEQGAPLQDREGRVKDETELLRQKEYSVADHIRRAASDGCFCEPCIAAREAFQSLPQEAAKPDSAEPTADNKKPRQYTEQEIYEGIPYLNEKAEEMRKRGVPIVEVPTIEEADEHQEESNG